MNPTTNHTGIVYLIRPQSSQLHKVGYTTNLEKRISQLQTGSSMLLNVVKFWPGNPGLEQALHRKLSRYQTQGEWFRLPKIVLRQLEMLDIVDVELVKLPDYSDEAQAKPLLRMMVAARELAEIAKGETSNIASEIEQAASDLIWTSEAKIDIEPFNGLVTALRLKGLRGKEQKRFDRIENSFRCFLLWKDVETRWQEKFGTDSLRVATSQVIAGALADIPLDLVS